MMRILKVIPLSRGIGHEVLTYFTSQDIKEGTLVTVPLRKKIVPAVVIETIDARNLKKTLKDADYALKKIVDFTTRPFFLPSFFRAAQAIAHYHGETVGSVIAALVPKGVLDAYRQGLLGQGMKDEVDPREYLKPEPPWMLQTHDEERMAHYKSLVRETFAKGYSVFLCLPTVSDIMHILPSLERGIEPYVHVLHGELTKKKVVDEWKNTLEEPHPVLIAGLATFLSIPRHDIKTILLERENSSSYTLGKRPCLDLRVCAEYIAKERRARLILGDMYLRTETIYRKESGDALEFSPMVFRSLSSANTTLVNMKEHSGDTKKKAFAALSPELKRLAEETYAESDRMFIFVGRKGLHSTTVCGDCGTTVTCSLCTAPLVLHKSHSAERKNIFICHKCGMMLESSDQCAICGSFRLTPLGIGAEFVEEEMRKLFPGKTILRLDKESAPTKKKLGIILRTFYDAPSGILIGTEMAMPYLKKTASVTVASIDALLTLPDFRVNERVFTMLLRARNKAGKNFLLQTRTPEMSVFEHVVSGNLLAFYREEIAIRQKLHYPPFTVLIKITMRGTKEKINSDSKKMETFLQEFKPDIFPAFTSKVGGRYIQHVLVRIEKERWPDETLLEIIKSLPPSFEVRVNPESIL